MIQRACLSLLLLAISGFSVSFWNIEPAHASYPVTYNFLTAATIAALHPNEPPPGANIAGCKPTQTHPNPVILVNGTFENQYDNWAGLAPILANDGYCVYTFDYGKTSIPFFYQLGSVPESANELANYVNYVLSISGAKSVDLVGHSQGGMLSEYYAKFFGGGRVNQIVSIAPTSHGTTLDGLANLASAIPGVNSLVYSLCQACVDQEYNSAVIQKLDNGAITVPGPHYTIIETLYDKVVTPAPSAAFVFEPGVNNELVQNYCFWDFSGHVGLVYDPIAWQLVLNALDPSHAVAPYC